MTETQHSLPQIDEARRLLREGRIDLAAAAVGAALVAHEPDADAHSLMANILDGRDDWQNSLVHLRRAYELMPAAPQVRLNLALALLRVGNYREGLALYEARIDKPAWSGLATLESRTAARQLMLKHGEAVEGRCILLLAEQGLGDAIMFARYVPMLARRGARIALACNPTLRDFFARVPGIEKVLAPPAEQPLAQINLAALPFDAWLPLASLAYLFGTEPQSIPAAGGFWTPDAARVAAWRSRYAAMGRAGALKVGLVFDCNRAAANHAARSMGAADLLPLLGLQKAEGESGARAIDFVNLQHGAAGRELAALAPNVFDLKEALPLDDYGAALAATDLLITVDTMAAHLAGAIGHPAFVAVPQSPQWFWGLAGETTPWYESLRIFRQCKAGHWPAVVVEMTSSLRTNGSGAKWLARFCDVRQARHHDVAKSWARFERGVAQLRRGEFAAGFADYEARLELPLWRDQALPLAESIAQVEERRLKPDDDVRGRRIAVFTEQGLGDTFFGARYLDALTARGAVITVICRQPMRPFFARLRFVDTLLSPPDDRPHAKIDMRRLAFDAFCPLLSLPHALRIAGTWTAEPYLRVDEGQVAAWRARMVRQGGGAERRKVGLVWQANPSSPTFAERSLALEHLRPLQALADVDFINLQHGPAGRRLKDVLPDAVDIMPAPLSLDEFAAALAATDIVVSVDTAAAHCAGALHRPVFIVLPTSANWFWGEKPEEAESYPSARLFRRGAGADWLGTIEAVRAALQDWAGRAPRTKAKPRGNRRMPTKQTS